MELSIKGCLTITAPLHHIVLTNPHPILGNPIQLYTSHILPFHQRRDITTERDSPAAVEESLVLSLTDGRCVV